MQPINSVYLFREIAQNRYCPFVFVQDCIEYNMIINSQRLIKSEIRLSKFLVWRVYRLLLPDIVQFRKVAVKFAILRCNTRPRKIMLDSQ